jgi:hypothetical protein
MFEKDAESQCAEANIQTPVQSFLMAEDGIQLTIGASYWITLHFIHAAPRIELNISDIHPRDSLCNHIQ